MSAVRVNSVCPKIVAVISVMTTNFLMSILIFITHICNVFCFLIVNLYIRTKSVLLDVRQRKVIF